MDRIEWNGIGSDWIGPIRIELINFGRSRGKISNSKLAGPNQIQPPAVREGATSRS